MWHSVQEWWNILGQAMTSLAMLVSWEIRKERNGHVFRNHSSTIPMMVARLKDEVWRWSLVDAKASSNVMPRK
jgi:hypothetical protein